MSSLPGGPPPIARTSKPITRALMGLREERRIIEDCMILNPVCQIPKIINMTRDSWKDIEIANINVAKALTRELIVKIKFS